MRELWRKLLWHGRRSGFQAQLDDEIRFHIESRVEDLERSGVPAGEAGAQAMREFGSRLKTAEETSSLWTFQWIEDFFSDMRYAARAFRRNPGFAATAIFCLALGIGANTTIFNITTSFLFSEPSARDSERLIAIWEGGNSSSPLADYKAVRDANLFDGLAGINIEREANWREDGQTRRFYAGIVTDDYFTTVGSPFFLGRGIARGETNAVVLSYRVWRNVFSGSQEILGHRMVLDGRVYLVTGVLPRYDRSVAGFGISPDIYMPVQREDEVVQFYARMPEGMSIAIARDRLRGVFEEMDRLRPKAGSKRARGIRVTGVTGFDVLNQMLPGAVTAFFAMLLTVTGLVLLIACANVTSLLLARASSRSQELAVRLSLGASRRRIVRHLLAESLLLSGLGAMAGLGINLVCARLINNFTLPVPVPIHLVVTPDWRLLYWSLGLVLASSLLCGLLPAFYAVRRGVSQTLKQEERQTTRTWSLRSVLVSAQLAISIVLLAAGLLFVHNLIRATSMDPGFDVRHTVWASMRLVTGQYDDPGQARQTALVRTALEKIGALPGIESAAVTRRVPLNDNCMMGVPMRTDLSPSAVQVRYQCNNVGPDYFRTIGISLLSGREFSEVDRKGTERVAIVNETFAHQVFGTVNPIGHTIKGDFPEGRTTRIIGLVKDSKYFTLGEEQRLAVYEPYFASDEPVNLQFLLRVSGPPAAYVRPVTELLGRLDSNAAIETKPMSDALGLALLPSRVGAAMLGSMGILGLMLAAIGLYGVLLYTVTRRTREIGLRVALGAKPSDVLGLVGRHGLSLVGAGMAIGLLLAYFAMRPLALFLVPGLEAVDSTAFLAVIGLLGAVATIATLAPASRALRIDPMAALRHE